MKLKTYLRNTYPLRWLYLLRDLKHWADRGFQAPSPHFVKQACLIRNSYPDAVWVESGTYLGQTTEVLAKHSERVYSIEPEPTLFANAKSYFSDFANVEILNGTSEQIFPDLLPRINGNVNFWLDGHFSAGSTFKGTQDSPVIDELKCISTNLKHFGNVCVLIDDIRYCNPQQAEYSGYPTLNAVVEWAKENHLNWHIEHDIFIARN